MPTTGDHDPDYTSEGVQRDSASFLAPELWQVQPPAIVLLQGLYQVPLQVTKRRARADRQRQQPERSVSQALATPTPTTSAPRVITVETNTASAVEEPSAPADPNPTRSAPRVINVDKNAAYPKAEALLKAAGILPEGVELRQVKYLNNLIEQDHRFIKRLVKPGLGFFSMETAGRTLQGYEVMHMIRKGQISGVGKGDITGQVSFIARRFGVAA